MTTTGKHSDSDPSFVVVGAGLAGATAATSLRERGFDGRLVVVGDEDEPPYERPPLSKAYLAGGAAREEAYVHPEEWYAEHDVELWRGARATEVDLAAHRVVLADGRTLRWDRLLLATGSEPRRLPIPGGDLDGVVTLRRLPDSDRLRATIAAGGPLVVIGAGWIGLEVAAVAREAGLDVTVLEAADVPLARVLGPEMGAFFADLHRQHGVDLRLGVGVAEVVGHDGRATGVRLADGEVVEGRAVLMATGAVPRLELAQEAGLDVDGGVLVDEHLTTSDPDVFAAGDIAAAWHPLLERRLRVEHWATALNQGPVAAASMLGEDEVYDKVPYFFTDQYDLGMEYTGHADAGPYDVVVRGDLAKRAFVAFWLDAGRRVAAAMPVNTWDLVPTLERMIVSGEAYDAERLADPAVDLTAV